MFGSVGTPAWPISLRSPLAPLTGSGNVNALSVLRLKLLHGIMVRVKMDKTPTNSHPRYNDHYHCRVCAINSFRRRNIVKIESRASSATRLHRVATSSFWNLLESSWVHTASCQPWWELWLSRAGGHLTRCRLIAHSLHHKDWQQHSRWSPRSTPVSIYTCIFCVQWSPNFEI